jgi:mono/diheme cytochrome c family protein
MRSRKSTGTVKTWGAVCIFSIGAAMVGCERKEAGAPASPAIATAASTLDQGTGAATQASQVEDGTSEYIPDPEIGREVFVQTCATCHGFQAQGLPHNGAALRTSPFIAGQTDKDLVAFIRAGRRAKDPSNKSGVAMPPSGNNPSLSDARLADVVAYLRQVQEEQKAEATTESTPATSEAK